MTRIAAGKRLTLIFYLIAALVLAACSAKEAQKEEEQDRVVTVEAAPALSTSIQLRVVAEGVLYPIQQESIVPKITAPIKSFHVERGASVRAGQLLAELDSEDLAAAVAENQATFEQAEANYEMTARSTVPQGLQKAELDLKAAQDTLAAQQKRYDNLQDLYKQGAIAQRDVNEANVALTQARNQVQITQRVLQDLQGVSGDQTLKAAAAQRDAARRRLEASQVQLGYAKITSRMDGIVTDRPLFPGETAASDKPLLTIMDLSSVIARTHVSQQNAAHLKVGNPANLYSPDGGTPVPGKVTQISPALDPANTTVEVWVQVANPGSRLKAGTSMRVEIVARKEAVALVIPESAVITGGSGETFVMMIGEGDKAKKQTVSLGIHDAGNVQVLEGLKGGDRVVSTGAYELSKLEPDVLKNTKLQIQQPKDEEEEEEDEK